MALTFFVVLILSPVGRIFQQDIARSNEAAAVAQTTAVACGAQAPSPIARDLYQRRPTNVLEPAVDYAAVIHTSCGDIKLDLLESEAPKTVNSFVFLAREGFYDGLIWHIVNHDFLIQTGDPNGQNGVAPDDAGYTIKDELPESADAYTYGALGIANRGPGTGGSQFFIVVHDLQGALRGEGEALAIEPKYTVFGRIGKKFFGSIEAIARQQTVGGEDAVEAVKPLAPVYIEKIEILEQPRR